MPHIMEHRFNFTTCFFLFLILALPYFSRAELEALNSEIYEIDYKGPETHSSVPPPHRSHGKPQSTPQKSSVRAGKAFGLMGSGGTRAENKASLLCSLKIIEFLSLLEFGIDHDLRFHCLWLFDTQL